MIFLKKYELNQSRDAWTDYDGPTDSNPVVKQSPLVHIKLSMELTYRIETPEAELVDQLTNAIRAIVLATDPRED